MKKPSVLFVTPLFPPDIGGPATYVHLVSQELKKRDARVRVLSFGRVRHYPKIIRHVLFFFLVIKEAKGYAVIYAQDPVSVGVPARAAAFLLRKKFAIRIAGDYAWEQGRQRFGVSDSIDDFQKKRYGVRTEFLRFLEHRVASSAHLVITPSNYFKNLVSGWISSQTSVKAIYNGIIFPENPFFVPYESREKTIISVGRLVPWKGFFTLISMIKEMPEWKLSIVGDGPDKEALAAHAKKEGVYDRVSFPGVLSWEETLRTVASSRIFVLNTSFESFSFQTIEALWARAPVIVTNVGSLPELVADGLSGFLVAPDDTSAIQKKIQTIDEDSTLRTMLIENARARARDFSVEKTTKELIEALAIL